MVTSRQALVDRQLTTAIFIEHLSVHSGELAKSVNLGFSAEEVVTVSKQAGWPCDLRWTHTGADWEKPRVSTCTCRFHQADHVARFRIINPRFSTTSHSSRASETHHVRGITGPVTWKTNRSQSQSVSETTTPSKSQHSPSQTGLLSHSASSQPNRPTRRASRQGGVIQP